MGLDPSIWGPHYWFFLHTMAMNYPHYPNSGTKKKYYEFIQNFHLFIPVEQISKEFSQLLEEYPVVPYLDNRESFVRWMHFMHNKINEKLEKTKISLGDFYKIYYDAYKPKEVKNYEFYKLRKKTIYFTLISILIGIIYWLYRF